MIKILTWKVGQYCKGARGAVILSAGIRQREGGLWESEEMGLLPMVLAMEMKPPAAPATAPGLGTGPGHRGSARAAWAELEGALKALGTPSLATADRAQGATSYLFLYFFWGGRNKAQQSLLIFKLSMITVSQFSSAQPLEKSTV